MSNKNNAVKMNMFFNVLKTVLSVVFPLITFTYVARILSVESVGKITFAKNVVSYFISFASLGINYYGIREAARLKENKKKLSNLFWSITIINIISTVLSLIVLLICIFNIDSLILYKELLLINTVSVILGGLSCEWIISAMEEYRFISIRYTFVQFVCLALMFAFIRSDDDAWIYAGLLVISSYGSSLLNYWYIARNKIVCFHMPSKAEIKKHVKPIFTLFFMLLSIELYTIVDTTMLGFIKGDRSVGLYTAAIKIPRMINSMIAACGAVLVPRLSYYYEENREKFLRLLNNSMKIVVILSIPCGLALFMLSDGIILLICGEQYHDAFITSRILAALVLIIPISVLFNNQIFIPMRKDKYVLCSTLVGAVVNILLNSFLIPLYSENGAAFASVIAELSVMIICLSFVKREFKQLYIGKFYLKQLLRSLLVLMVIIICTYLFSNSIVRLFASAIISIPLYFIVCRKDIFEILKKVED